MQRRGCSSCKYFVILIVVLWPLVSPRAISGTREGCEQPPYDAFDFWVGEWRVLAPDGEVAGRNRISSQERGCLVLERWRGSSGGTGTSMSYYDPYADKWRRLWVSPGVQIDINGGLVDGSMVLSGVITYLVERERYPFRGTWTPLDDGRVRQYFEESRAPGVWRPWFEGFYVRAQQPTDQASGDP